MFRSWFTYPSIESAEPTLSWTTNIDLPVWAPVVLNNNLNVFVASSASGENDVAELSMFTQETSSQVALEWSKFLFQGGLVYGSPILGNEWDPVTRSWEPVVYVAASADTSQGSNTYIYSFTANVTNTNSALYRWRYPATFNRFFSGLGQITGSGALNANGTLFFGLRALTGEDEPGQNGVLALRQGEQLWLLETDYGVSTVITDDLYVYFVSGGSLFCVQGSSGVVLWQRSLVNGQTGVPFNGFPSFGSTGLDIVVGYGEYLNSVGRANGTVFWRRQVNGNIKAAPAISGRKIFVGTDAGLLYGLKRTTENSNPPSELWVVVLNPMTSSPVVMGNGRGSRAVLVQLDDLGRLNAVNLRKGSVAWTYDYGEGFSALNGGQPVVNQYGQIIVGTQSSNVMLAVGDGWRGGCPAGTETRSDISEANPDFCALCKSGSFSGDVGRDSCTVCPPGRWSDDIGATFCYTCEYEESCLGGNNCTLETDGVACSQCVRYEYYRFVSLCKECPEGRYATLMSSLYLIGAVVFVALYMHFKRGTKFAYEITKDDVISLWVDNAPFCTRMRNKCCPCCGSGSGEWVDQKVTRVMDDYTLEVEGHFGNARRIKNTKFVIKKCRRYGDEITAKGTGFVSIDPVVGQLEERLLDGQDNAGQWEAQSTLDPSQEQEGGHLDSGATGGRMHTASSFNLDKQGIKLSNFFKSYGDDFAVHGDSRSIVRGKSTSAGTEMIMAASLVMVSYAQTTSFFVSIPVGWPAFMLNAFETMSRVISFDIPTLIPSPDCVWGLGYTSKWLMAMLAPLCILVLLRLLYLSYGWCVQHVLKRKQYQNRVINVACIIVVLLYVFLTAKTVEPFACTKQTFRFKTMNADPSIQCEGFFGNPRYSFLVWLGICFFCLYGIGIPMTLWSMLTKAKREHMMGSIVVRQRFGWLYMRFTSQYYYWEIVILSRKFILVLIVLLGKSVREMIVWSMFIVCLAILVQYHYRPFNCFDCLLNHSRRCTHWGAMDSLEMGLLFANLAVLVVGLYLLRMGADSGDVGLVQLIILCTFAAAAIGLIVVVAFLYIKTKYLQYKFKNSGERNEYQTAQNMNAVNTDAIDFFCGC
uniref:Pyrrolo-quinoline quinone repeat domain-containing protein n=1 Tax=Rhizochromulina marina TaxID=1034831 RepID=A0A7S2SXR1_9STRA